MPTDPASPSPQALDLTFLLSEVELAQADATLYVHQQTGQLYTIAEEEIAILGEVHDDMLPPQEVEILDEIRQVLTSDHWIPLPTSVNPVATLLAFSQGLEDENLRDRLQKLLQSAQGISQGIVDFLDDTELEADWLRFQRQALRRAIAAQLQAHQIPFTGLAP